MQPATPQRVYQALPGDEIDNYASEVYDHGLLIQDLAQSVVDALNDGTPVNPHDLDLLKNEIFLLEVDVDNLKEALNNAKL